MRQTDFTEPADRRDITNSFPIRWQPNENATTLSMPDAVTYYFTVSRDGLSSAREVLLAQTPSIGAVVHFTLQNPGLEVRDRAIDLLSYLIPSTLRFARMYNQCDLIPRPVFANKTWEILISALGLADHTYAPFCRSWIEQQLESPNPVRRLAAHDALEALGVDAAGAP